MTRSDEPASAGKPLPSDLKVNMQGPRTKGKFGRMPANVSGVFGTDEEIAARGDDLMMVPGAVHPAENPTAFKQIPGQVSTGKSVNRAPLQRRNQTGDHNEGPGPGRP